MPTVVDPHFHVVTFFRPSHILPSNPMSGSPSINLKLLLS
jgi:hypothetical protein